MCKRAQHTHTHAHTHNSIAEQTPPVEVTVPIEKELTANEEEGIKERCFGRASWLRVENNVASGHGHVVQKRKQYDSPSAIFLA